MTDILSQHRCVNKNSNKYRIMHELERRPVYALTRCHFPSCFATALPCPGVIPITSAFALRTITYVTITGRLDIKMPSYQHSTNQPTCLGIPKFRLSLDGLIFIMEIPYLERRSLHCWIFTLKYVLWLVLSLIFRRRSLDASPLKNKLNVSR